MNIQTYFFGILGTLIWDNLVGVIVTLTLIIWIPLSCIVRQYVRILLALY